MIRIEIVESTEDVLIGFTAATYGTGYSVHVYVDGRFRASSGWYSSRTLAEKCADVYLDRVVEGVL